MNNCLSRFLDDESAVSAIEYALLASLIVVVIFASVTTVGAQVASLYNYIKDQVILAMQ
ncbi:Flp family type IVb pilin [Massilia sp. erpn]|uniref:Flp family type IVb pilin n=1 Tax=Massilia sp. erpn TaxID=2738142 RepID=UPI002104FE19|nr:Flp family type IVb pilin [Massilia sp. erpn]UTY58815.1 Flp family type IVb pilin [Massilia sp. erpn]